MDEISGTHNQYSGDWYTVVSGKTPGATVGLSFRGATPGSYYLRMLIGANRVYVASTGPALRVIIQ